ncbi:MAG: T9SS type A sorting domain-containing protein [Bacteroidetes bacterium]|nr:T9SS type A sorting domain-containing protein [Bacteroidota bacterium]
MKGTPDMRLFFLFSFFFCCSLSYAQLKQVSIVQQTTLQKRNQATRVQSLSAMKLPFWDDFSFNNYSKNYPHDSLWQYGHSVWVNTGMGINPPTLKVATFDGIDSLGKPYSVNLALAKGVADKLISRPIRMDLVDPSRQDSVFIFFYYQYQGNGEPPDPQDEFSLWFKQDSTTWKKVWTVQYDTLKDKTKFVPVKIFVKANCSSCFHNDFQFRFQNFARLSGPFDTWNLDYVYVNNGKGQYSPKYADIPDRAIAAPLTSFLKQYNSIPAKHLISKGDSLLNTPKLVLTNQRKDQSSPRFQPTSLIVRLRTTTRLNKVVSPPSTSQLDSVPGILVHYDFPSVVALNSLPSFTSFDSHIDSIAMKFLFKLNSGDHVNKIDVNTGDYDTVVYKPIEFRYNDTTSTNFIFSNYYAYDDGVAEYAATLTNPGNYLAYQFDMMYSKSDTLVAVDFYFPHVGDETNQVLQLMILDNQVLDATTKNPIVLTQQDLTVGRTESNKFTRVTLGESVVVSQNLMIRPVFGNSAKAKGPLTEVEEKKLFAHPNPNHGIFYLPQLVENLQIVDVTGRPVSFVQEDSFESTQVTLRNPSAGIYLARYFSGTQWRSEKIMVLP